MADLAAEAAGPEHQATHAASWADPAEPGRLQHRAALAQERADEARRRADAAREDADRAQEDADIAGER